MMVALQRELGQEKASSSRLRKNSIDAKYGWNWLGPTRITIASGCSKRPFVSPAQPRCAKTRRSAGKAAASETEQAEIERFRPNGDSIRLTLASTFISMKLTDVFSSLLDDQQDLRLTGAARDRQRNFILMPVEHEIKTCGADREISKFDPFQEWRKHGTYKLHKALRPIDLQTQASLQGLKPGAGRPRLRSAGGGIACRTFTRSPGESTKQFRHSMEVKEQAGVEEPGQDLDGSFSISVGRHPCRNQCVIVRPHGPVMIGHGIVPCL